MSTATVVCISALSQPAQAVASISNDVTDSKSESDTFPEIKIHLILTVGS